MTKKRPSYIVIATLALAPLFFLNACRASIPIATVEKVDLDRFMGDWYVIANIPTSIEKGAHNAVETYRRGKNNIIHTTFRFNKNAFDGPIKTYNPTGFVVDDGTGAHWKMRFIWPLKMEYRVVYLTEDYSQTVIGRSKRDFLWIMARAPHIPDDDYQTILAHVKDLGYDISLIQKVPHSQ